MTLTTEPGIGGGRCTEEIRHVDDEGSIKFCVSDVILGWLVNVIDKTNEEGMRCDTSKYLRRCWMGHCVFYSRNKGL